VGAPVVRSIDDPALRRDLFRALGEQSRKAGWAAIAVLLVTGVLNLGFRGVLAWDVLGDPDFWATPYGRALAWKLAAVTVMLTVQAVHDFVHGPRASRATPGSPEALALRRRAALLARLNAVVGLGLVYVAVRLARGGL
ncbi:MAG: CopD family protein, partial [Gemmatimonadota bacterium]